MPIFDLDAAIQQGFNRDPSNNDWNVEARNLEVALEDAAGSSEFRVYDSDNVGVMVVGSDGYLSVNGNAEVHGGNLLVEHRTDTNPELLTLKDSTDQASVYLLDSDPDGSITAQKASVGLNYSDGYLYINRDGASFWDRFVFQFEVDAAVSDGVDGVTLQVAYDNDPDGGDVTITTNSTDGALIIAGSEKLQVTATGGLDLDTGFDMDGTGPFDVDISGAVSIDSDAASNFTVTGDDLTLETQTSGDIFLRIPAGSGTLTIDEGAGTNYLQTDTTAKELKLGDVTGTVVDVRTLNDLTVDGDLYVNGTETILNTEDLFIEDNMIRLNINAAPGFSGTTGMEAEVGSDGYVEFHWDDSQSRWEVSIDRNTTPGAQTFRPLPYLAEDAATLDLSSTGTDGYPTAGPNADAGASVVNTNTTNFPASFGPDMADNSVQSALEAIDGYLLELSDAIINNTSVTLQVAYDNDTDGADATITTNATDGAVVIAGTEKLQVTATGGLDLDTGFDMDGSGSFDVDITGVVSIDSDAASNFTVDGGNLTLSTTTTGTVTVDGVDGVILDGNGSNVRPATNDADSLGTATFGWTTVYLRNVQDAATVSLLGSGGATTPNTTSGASAVGTDADNFDNFGPDMTADSVQGALEAIDGYFTTFQNDTLGIITLQRAYDNDPDGGDVTILTNATDGALIITGSEKLQVTATGGLDLDTGFDMDGAGPFDVDITGAVSIDSDAASNFTVDGGNLTLNATTSGQVLIDAVDNIALGSVDGYVGVGTASPNQMLTVDGVVSLAEQAVGVEPTTGYGKIFVKDDDGYAYYTHEDGSEFNIVIHSADEVSMQRIDGTTYWNVQHMQDIFHSTGSSSGGLITNGAGDSVDVSAGTGFIRADDNSLSTLFFFDWAALNIALTPGTIEYIGVEYNAGVPQITSKNTETWNLQDEFPLGLAFIEDGYLHIEQSEQAVGDHAGQMIRRLVETMRYERDDRDGGLLIGETGTRNVTVTAGAIWTRLNRIAMDAIDTSAADTFFLYYRDGGGDQIVDPDAVQWPNDAYDDGSGVLETMPAGTFSNLWFYRGVDFKHLYCLYGRGAFDTAAEAQSAGRPQEDIPLVVQTHSMFIGRIIFEQGASTATLIQSAFTDVIGTSSVTDHGSLSGLGDDDHAQYILADGTRPLTAVWDAAFKITTPEIDYIGTLTLDGSTGIILDGNGGNVVPASDNTDSLGSITKGWETVYIRNVQDSATVGLDDVGSASTPNTTSGASAVGTDADNYDTFGSLMTADSVQGALEAIDGYFTALAGDVSGTTLQTAYKNDVDGSDATITTDATDGSVVIAGTESFRVTAVGGLDLNTGFDMDGAGPFDVDITGAVSIDADAYSNFLVQDAGLVVGTVGDAGTLDLLGQAGIVLTSNGNNVTPADSCNDSLGDATHGWTTIWLCNGNNVPVSIRGPGSASTPNTTSGAYVVGADADNFATFGGAMGSDTVQAALEAIDGYLESLSLEGLDTTYTKEVGVDINGAVLNGNVKINNVGGTATLDFKTNKTDRAQWTIPVPSDWDGVSDIVVEVVWSPDNTNAGNCEWRLEYKSLALTELASAAATTDDYTQAAGGTTDAIQTTGTNLSIAAGDVSVTDEIIVINVVRRGLTGGDTFTGDAQVHLVKYVYTAQNIV